MTWGVLNGMMLVGLAGAALPVIIHLLNRRRDTVIEWGAMQFLELGKRSRQKIRLAELLLMLARMSLLALAALAMARPFLARGSNRGTSASAGALALAADAPRRDVVVVIDASASMERRDGGPAATTAHSRAIAWARRFAGRSRPGDAIAVLLAGQGVRHLVEPAQLRPGAARRRPRLGPPGGRARFQRHPRGAASRPSASSSDRPTPIAW